jgi:integrase
MFQDVTWKALDSRLRLLGLDAARVHDLRHTFVADLIGAGVPVLQISRMLGHASVGFTLQIYGHLTNDAAEQASQAAGELLDQALRMSELSKEGVLNG